jgi:hypothetical protein
MNTQENNKLIAEFMGMQHTDIGWYDNEETLQLQNNTFDELKYHTSWDWLMPVVEKIEEDDEVDVNILLNGTRIFKWRTDTDIVNNVAQISFDKKIEHVYQAVVEFNNSFKTSEETIKELKKIFGIN